MPRVVPDYKGKAKKRIIEAAITIFAQKGYHKTKMTDIAKKLGVSKGTIYQYFKSKEELFHAVADEPFRKLREEPLSSILKTGNLLDIASNTFYDKLWSMPLLFSEPNWPTSLMFEIASEASRSPKLAESLKQVYNDALTFLEKFFDEHQDNGVIKKSVNTHQLAMGLIALQDGLQGYELFGVNREDTSRAWEEISKIILNGVKVNEASSEEEYTYSPSH